MKKYLLIAAVALLACACTSEKPTECYIPKNTVEFAGNVFTAFSLGADVRLYSVQNPENSAEWTVQAVVPVRKEVNTPLTNLSISLVPLDDRGVRVRDGYVLDGEDLPNLEPVYNAGVNVERSIVFSCADKDKKYMSASDAAQLVENTKGVRMDFNIVVPEVPVVVVETPTPAPAPAAAPAANTPKEYPMTLDGLCRKYGVYGLLNQYERLLRNGNKKGAKNVEDQLWAIEKRVKSNKSIPESLRDRFVDYIEDKEDEIEDRY